MLTFDNYDLYSFTVGCKHQRAFSLNSSGGTIIDYILGQCGANESKLPSNFFSSVIPQQNQIGLTSFDRKVSLICDLDSMSITGKSICENIPFVDQQMIIDFSTALFENMILFLNNPKIIFYGIVWSFVEKQHSQRNIYSHPAADYLAKNVSKISLNANEYPSNFFQRLSFRKRLQESLVKKDINDYKNIHITIEDKKINSLWEVTDIEKQQYQQDDFDVPTVQVVSVDIQHVCKPLQNFSFSKLNQHCQYAPSELSGRISEILSTTGFSVGNANVKKTH